MIDPANVEDAIRLVRADGVTPIAILDNAYDAVLTEQLLDDNGGEETLTFSLPISDPKTLLIQNEMYLAARYVTHDPADAPYQATSVDTVHLVRTKTEGYDDSGNRIFQIYAEARWYDLATEDLITVQPSVATAAAAMAVILRNTGWTVGVIGVPAPVGSVSWGSADLISPLAALRSLPAVFGGELVFDNVNKQVSLLPRRGDQTPHLLYIREGNMSHDTKTVSTTGLTTRVHPIGANGIDISSLTPGNVGYIEDYSYYDNLGLPRSVKAQPITNDQISDPTALLAWARNQLAVMAKPMVTYDIGISLFAGKAVPRLGDLVRVTDPTLQLDTYARCSRREFNLIQPWLTNIVVDTAAYTLATPSGGGNGLPTGTTTGSDFSVPDPPSNLTLQFGSALDAQGNWNTFGVASWVAPTANTDGTPLSDLDHFDIEVLPFDTLGGAWLPQGGTSDTSAGFGFVPSGHPVSVRVRTADHSGNRSAWVTATADVPLPAPFYLPPSTPTLDAETFPLSITVNWNGLDNNNVPYQQDVDTIEVHLLQVSGPFSPTAGTLVSVQAAALGGFVLPLTGLTPGLPYTVELVAVGRSDVRSNPSAGVTATVLPIGPTHLIYNGDQDNMVPDGSFETPGGQATLMADPSWSSAWSFVTSGTAPGALGAGTIAHGDYALMGTGGTLTGTTRSLVLARAQAMVGQKFWVKIKYRNATTGGACTLNVHSLDTAGNVVDTATVALAANGAYATAAFSYTLPAGAVTFEVYVTMNSATSAGWLLVDVAECRAVIQTAIIDALAVTDAQIASASISKLIAGSLVADMTVSARIKTADTGQRLEMNSTGLFAYTSGGVNSVAIRSDGSASFTGTITGSTIIGGTIETATSGHRVVIAAGTDPTQITFPTGASGEVVYASIGTSATALYLFSPQDPAAPSVQAQMRLDKIGDIVLQSGRNVDIYHGSVGTNVVTVHDNLVVIGSLRNASHPYVLSTGNGTTYVDSDTTTVTTDSSGFATISHGLGTTPAAVTCTGKSPNGGSSIAGIIMADSFGSSTFRIRVFTVVGAVYASASVTFSWRASA